MMDAPSFTGRRTASGVPSLAKVARVATATEGFTTPPQSLLSASGTSFGPLPDAHTASRAEAEATRPATPPFTANSISSGFAVEEPRDARILKILEESRHRMLSAADIRTLIVTHDPFTERPDTDTPDWAIFKECPKQRRRAKKSDRWANSGGMKGSRDLPYNSACPFVRRRYGSVFSHHDPHAKGKRYYEYTLLHQREDGTTFEDKSATLFHILPGPGETDRGRRAMPCDYDGTHDRQRQRQAQIPQQRQEQQIGQTQQQEQQAQQQRSRDTQSFAQFRAAQSAAMREAWPTAASTSLSSASNDGASPQPAMCAGMDMLSAVAALRSLGSATP
jgi:hypothetical protein